MPPAPPPCATQWPARTDPLEKFLPTSSPLPRLTLTSGCLSSGSGAGGGGWCSRVDPCSFDPIVNSHVSWWGGKPFQLGSCLPCFLSRILPPAPQLVKTVELPPDRNYVPVSHPHGVTAVGSFRNFCTASTGSSQQCPGSRCSGVTLNGLFRRPVCGDNVMSCGETRAELGSANHQSLDFILSQPQLGQAAVILVGGAQKALHTIPGSTTSLSGIIKTPSSWH
ncbi:2-acylglycerol O-acyltransferase 2-like [Dama dama]